MDWVSRNMYVTDPGKEAIEVISLDTRARLVKMIILKKLGGGYFFF